MVLNVIGNDYAYELEKLASSFFPEEHVTVVVDGHLKDGSLPNATIFDDENVTTVKCEEICDEYKLSVSYNEAIELSEIGLFEKTSLAESKNSLELHLAQLLYKVLCEACNLDLGWGLLTGIRPSKLLIRLMQEKGKEEGIEYFKDCLLVSDKKTKLAISVANAEERIIATSNPNSFSLYISIPFCPTRCSYCSFVSSAVNKDSAKRIVEPYFDNLLNEIEYTARISKECNIKMLSAYVGGGTPSTLSAEQIDELIKCIKYHFDMSSCKEFTFEAGRPDTITKDKLLVLHKNGIDRISINPQTMNDDVLLGVGRKHSASDVIKVYNMAREIGFNNINMDLIAGLPNDSYESFVNSLNKLISLNPESITIHSLAYKRSSDLSYTDGLFSATRCTSKMIDYANDTLYENGYFPYYMYRQAKSVGNLENVGWCKDNCESLYNIYMMEECHTILACGAGAVTKLKEPYGSAIERIFNFKYPFEYNDRFDEQIERKKAVLDFYERTSLSESN